MDSLATWLAFDRKQQAAKQEAHGLSELEVQAVLYGRRERVDAAPQVAPRIVVLDKED